MHNAPLLMRGGRTPRRPHPPRRRRGARARRRRALPDQLARTARSSSTALLTDEVKRGTVAVPHGWGHSGGWSVANAAGGANVNELASSDPADLERLAGMAHLNGIPIRVERVDGRGSAASVAAEPAPVA